MPKGVPRGHGRSVALALAALVLLSVALPGAGAVGSTAAHPATAGEVSSTPAPASAGSAAASTVARTYEVSVESTSGGPVYLLDGERRPEIELVEGRTYRFVLDESVEGHPFHLSTSPVGGSDRFPGAQVTRGVVVTEPYEGNEHAAESGTVFVSVPDGGFDAEELYYQSATDAGAGARITTAAATPSPTGPLTVDGEADGDDAYETIGAALDAAGDGDRIEIRPGTYREQLTLARNVTLIAPEGATLDGSTLEASSDRQVVGITVPQGSGAAPTVDGLTIAGYDRGVVAAETSGGWTLRNVTVTDSFRTGVYARYASGAWTIAGSRIEDNGLDGLVASYASGAWTLRETVVSENGDDGVRASQTSGRWTIRNATVAGNGRNGLDVTADRVSRERSAAWTVRDAVIADNGLAGVVASANGGDWAIRNAVVAGSGDAGVVANGSAGDWTIRNVTIVDSGGTGVAADSAGGDWRIRNAVVAGSGSSAIVATGFVGPGVVRRSTFRDNGGSTVIDARRAVTRIDATLNWWGTPDGPDADDCVGNVTCRLPLATAPGAGAGSVTAPVVGEAAPTDPDGDGRYEDVTGDGVATPGDATVLFNAVFDRNPVLRDNAALFDFTGDGQVTAGDATVLFAETFQAG